MLFIEVLKAILFGIVEGICEWLPISSTGHLIILDEFITLNVSPEFYEMFEVVIQLGAILAVLLIFFEKLYPFSTSKGKKEKRATLALWLKVALAVIPSAVVGALLDGWFNKNFYNYVTVALMLIVYGVVFIMVDRSNNGVQISTIEDIGYKEAFFVGAFQVLSIIPGTSRSGSTMLGGRLLGLSRAVASEFSFFLAIPTMLGAGALKAAKFFLGGYSVSFAEWMILAVGSAVAFLVSLLVIRFLLDFVKRHSFLPFGVYRITLGTLVLLYFIFKG